MDVRKWHNDVKIEQVVLRIAIVNWEMYQSDGKKLQALWDCTGD